MDSNCVKLYNYQHFFLWETCRSEQKSSPNVEKRAVVRRKKLSPNVEKRAVVRRKKKLSPNFEKRAVVRRKKN